MKASELVLAPDGSLYHIRLRSETLADDVILVGDPGRVDMFKTVFDSVEHESQSRELHALTGCYHGHRLTAFSTGMGCDNIDIVMTELDAAANYDLELDEWRKEHRTLRLVRVGTSGSLQPTIACGEVVASRYAVGLDGLMNYYAEWQSPLPDLEELFARHMQLPGAQASPYGVAADATLLDRVGEGFHRGITATAPGFYGPQGRAIRLHPAVADLNERLATFAYDGTPVTNLEMETSAIYGFSHLMGHKALTVCLIIANRPLGTFLNDYHAPMRQLVGSVVERLSAGE